MFRKTKIIFFVCLLFTAAAYPQLRLSTQVGVQIPTGDFAELAGTGFGINATFEYWQETALSFTGSVGYNRWGPEAELPANQDYSLTSIPVLLGIRYYLARGDFHPYIAAQLGLHFISSEYEREVGNTTVSTSDSESRFGMAPVFGFRYHLNESLDLDFNVKYNIISGDNTTTYIGFNGGVQFAL